ncbi:hypothetical protein J4210_03170 [Candidatus Woesearchaeota archaeon]|nr:hypothetical protein [Candidatus Woesearchaeota archaeon]
MRNIKILMVVGVLLILLAGAAIVQADTEIPESYCSFAEDCAFDETAADFCSAGECSCSEETSTCFISESTTDTSTDTSTDQEGTAKDATAAAAAAAAAVDKKLIELQALSASVEEKITNLEQVVQLLQQQITLLSEKIDLLNSQQFQSKESVTTVATGLAGLQKDVGTAQENLEEVEEDVAKIRTFRLIVTIIGLLLLSAAILLGLQYYLKTKKTDPRLLQYILKQVRQGQRYPQIHQTLAQAGWNEDDIKKTFQEVARKVAGRKDGQPTTGMESKKVVLLAGFALFFIVGVILVLQGVTTGKAIHFGDVGELGSAVKKNIETNLEKNEFYGLVKKFDLCLEVEDEDNVVSYRVVKTLSASKVLEASVHCDNTDKYAFAVKFKSWEAFDLLSNSLTCGNIKTLHAKKQMYVLPSKYIEPGFSIEPTTDLSAYCTVLSKCMTPQQLQEAGIEC